jgi:hypothetical protein
VRIARRADGALHTGPYFVAGVRWEQQTGVAWFHRKWFAVENIVVFGGWDCQTGSLAAGEQIACLNTFAVAIESDQPGTVWAFEPDYQPGGAYPTVGAGALESRAVYAPREPGDDRPPRLMDLPRRSVRGLAPGASAYVVEDPFWERQIAEWGRDRARWERTAWISAGDEWGVSRDKAIAILAYMRGVIQRLGLPQRPLTMTLAQGQVQPGCICDLFDACAVELYSPPPGTRPRATILAELDAEMSRELGVLAGQDVIAIPQCYKRNEAWTDDPNAAAVCAWGYEWAWNHRDQVLAAKPFSGARKSGIWDHYDLYWPQVQRGFSRVTQGGIDIGPEPPPQTWPLGKVAALSHRAQAKWFGGPYDDRYRTAADNSGYGYWLITWWAADAHGQRVQPGEANYAPGSTWAEVVNDRTGSRSTMSAGTIEGSADGVSWATPQWLASGGDAIVLDAQAGATPGDTYTVTLHLDAFSDTLTTGAIVDHALHPYPDWLLVQCRNALCTLQPAGCVAHADRRWPCRGAQQRCPVCGYKPLPSVVVRQPSTDY